MPKLASARSYQYGIGMDCKKISTAEGPMLSGNPKLHKIVKVLIIVTLPAWLFCFI